MNKVHTIIHKKNKEEFKVLKNYWTSRAVHQSVQIIQIKKIIKSIKKQHDDIYI
jgi:hypothetical protein